MRGIVDIYPPNYLTLFLFFLGFAVLGEVLYVRLSALERSNLSFRQVIDRLRQVMKDAKYTKVEQKMVWRGIVEKLAQSATLEAPPTSANELSELASRKMSEVEQSRPS